MLVRRPVVGPHLERREDERAALRIPRPFVGRAGALGGKAGADPEMLAVPGTESVWILRAKENPANSKYRHRRSPRQVVDRVDLIRPVVLATLAATRRSSGETHGRTSRIGP
ncbi:MAG: hypothetical protein ABIR57_14190 [Aeromicrobium sp.]